jgi:arylsulfatase A-like enzyme
MKKSIFATLNLLLVSLTLLAQKKPNVIYIYADDLGYGELGVYGQQKIKTPFLDAMAKEGIRFTNHYTSAPVCAPARCMLMTGQHAGHSYIRGNYELGGFKDDKEGGQMPLPENTFTIAKLMKSAGYQTALVGKWGLGMNNTTGDPNLHGFDYYYGFLDQKQAHNLYPTHLWENGKWDTLRNTYQLVHEYQNKKISIDSIDFDKFKGKDYAATKMMEKALAFIQKNQKNPFFLYLPLPLPHLSLQAPEEEILAYQGKFPETIYTGQKGGYVPTKYPRATYAAMITYLDKQVGRIIETLKKYQIDENTLIMFSSDNGATFDVGGVDTQFFNSVAGLRGRKQDLYEGGIREPMMARWPGKIKPGQTTDHPSAQFDVMATLADLTGAKIPVNTDGISFLPTLLGKAQAKHPFIYFEFPEKSGQVAVRIGNFKGVKSNMKKNKLAPWELYDLSKDPFEQNDIAQVNPDLIKKMEDIAKKQHRPSHVKEWEFVDPKF